jgi:hypothetical protein
VSRETTIRRLTLWGPLVAAALVVIGFIAIEWFLLLPSPGTAAMGELSEIQTSALATFKELTQLFMTWGLAVIGATAYFLKAAVEGDHQLTRGGLLAAEAVILCVVASIFFGHLALNALLNMLAIDRFDVRDQAVVTYSILQYVTFLVSLLMFFVFIHVTYWSSVAKSRKPA